MLYNFEKTDRFEYNLIAHYPFNNNANDASNSGNDGTVNGPILTVE